MRGVQKRDNVRLRRLAKFKKEGGWGGFEKGRVGAGLRAYEKGVTAIAKPPRKAQRKKRSKKKSAEHTARIKGGIEAQVFQGKNLGKGGSPRNGKNNKEN